MFLRVLRNRQYSRRKAIAAYHIPPTYTRLMALCPGLPG